MREQLDQPPRARRALGRVVMTLLAWLVAFLIVLALLAVFGHWVESIPYVLNALVFTGVLVPIMGNLVMPGLGRAVARWVSRPSPTSRRREPESRTVLRPSSWEPP